MTKHLRRIVSVVAAVAIAMLMAVPFGTAPTAPEKAEAADNLTITVSNAQPGQTYKAYKLFDATVNSTRAGKTDAGTESEVADNGIRYSLPAGKSLETSYTYTGSDNQSHSVTGSQWFEFDSGGNVKKKSSVDTIDFASEAFRQWALQFGTQVGDTSGQTNSGTESSTITFTGLTDGYYFVTSTMGSLVTVTSIAPNAIVKDKNSTPDVNKTEDKKTSSVGEVVTYTVEVSIPTGQSKLIFHDRLGTGLDLQGTIGNDTDLTAENSPLTVKDGSTNLTRGNDYTVDYWNSTKSTNTGSTNGDNVTISFTSSYLSSLTTQKTVTLVYSAKLNSSAAINMPNEAFVTYGDRETESTKKQVYESSLGFVVNKIIKDTETGLSGAKFALSKESNLGNIDESYVSDTNNSSKFLAFDSTGTYEPTGTTKVFETTSANNNSLTFKGLNDNETNTISYYLYEVKAPDGYEKLTGPIEIQMVPRFDTSVTSEHESKVTGYTLQYKMPGDTNWTQTHTDDTDLQISAHSLSVANAEGSLLPSTGGPGTAWMYAIGGVLVAAAAVGLIARRRMRQH